MFDSHPLKENANRQELSAWWKLVYGGSLWNLFFGSYQKRLLHQAMQELLATPSGDEKSIAPEKVNYLHSLVVHSLHIYCINNQNPPTYLDELNNWVEINFKAQLTNRFKLEDSHSAEASTVTLHWQNKSSLYNEWMRASSCGLFARRSAATHTLDKVIKWYATCFIVDKREALEHIMDAIAVWLHNPEARRKPAVLALKAQIGKQMALLTTPQSKSDASPNVGIAYLPHSQRFL